MKEVKIEKCPFCGGKEFIEGRAAAYDGVVITTGALRYSKLHAVICRDCGSAVRMFCEAPEKLYPKKERRD